MHQVTIHEAQMQLARLIQQVVDGEEIVIAKEGKPLVKLVHMKENNPPRRLGTAKGQIQFLSDFDAPLEDFRNYV